MKWVIIKGVRYPSSVISAFAAYNMDNPFLKVRIRNKYHIVPFDDVNKMANQMVYLMDNYPDFVQIGRWWISKKAVMSWVPKGQAVDGSGWVISFTMSFGLEGGTQAAEELVSSCGLTEDECRKLQEESGSFDDEMLEFIDTIFGRKIDLDEDNQMIDIDISTMKVGDTYSFMNNQKEMVEIKAVKRSRLGCNGCYLSNSEILCKGCNKSERETNDNIMVVRIDKMDDVYRNDRPLDPEIGVVHSFRINNKIIKAVACQTVIRNDICSKCCFVDTNICSNMRCFSSVREDDKSVIFKKIEL